MIMSSSNLDESNSVSEKIGDMLSDEQKLRIQENREKALSLKRKRQAESTPTEIAKETDGFSNSPVDKPSKQVLTNKFIDTGGGFLLSADEISKNDVKKLCITENPPPILPPDQPECLECGKDFAGSFLFEKFDYPVCDSCRDSKEKHALITKTEAKKNYLLTDVDLEQRGTPLKFILSKNPHNSRWSDMKLYLLLQVEKRALEVWGSEDKVHEELEKREEKRNISKHKAYQKKMKALKMSVRSSLYTRSVSENHVHCFGAETYNSAEDTYTRSCLTCPFSETYEKM